MLCDVRHDIYNRSSPVRFLLSKLTRIRQQKRSHFIRRKKRKRHSFVSRTFTYANFKEPRSKEFICMYTGVASVSEGINLIFLLVHFLFLRYDGIEAVSL